MAQITSGIRSILSHPQAYSVLQNIMGANAARKRIVNDLIKPFPGMQILDLGCGPADILDYMEDIDYWGYDISDQYISKAKKKFGEGKAHFECKQFDESELANLPKFDVILAIGLLHHLDDSEVIRLLMLSRMALKRGGRILTVDPCFTPKQNIIARFLVAHDRGQNVRSKNGYVLLAKQVFESTKVMVRHQSWIPYTHCFMECTLNDTL